MASLGYIQERMGKLKDWALESNAIVKDFEFKDFKEVIMFFNNVAEIAEKMEHHPDFVIGYDKVRVSLSSHEEGELTSKDFDVAEEVDKI
ncbi:4a-hydroxytetrahydrobiopterin dehydratase [Candidatus Pacearchaeota archaeon]|nr:4a-hydroxytetrahydrobiopterin dehydratase [Candidatus Pacearchaeota archaeon]|tara:strand:- start:15510 stop:15779 length:270 start_codon:yes stop_codon:yes gene_type:complete